MLCASIDDEPRFIELLTTLIKEGTLPSYHAFVKESRQKKKRRRKWYEQEAKEAEEMKKREWYEQEGEEMTKREWYEQEAEEAEEMWNLDGGKHIAHCGEFTKLLCVSGENSHKATIRACQQLPSKKMDNTIGALEEKYCKGKGKASGSQTSIKKAKKKRS